MHSKLNEIISTYISLNDQDKELLASLFVYKPCKKGDVLIKMGHYVNNAFFIHSGYLKYTKLLKSGEELVIHLYAPNDFATSIIGFFLGGKAEEELHAITDCELLSISKADLARLYSLEQKWESFGRQLMESYLMEKELRIINQLALTARKRYLNLLASQPEMIKNVPIKYIASFIGIQPESLSRIRKNT